MERVLDLARMLRTLLPEDAGVAGLLALILLTDARRDARVTDSGRLVLVAEQDRVRWDRAAIREAPRSSVRRCGPDRLFRGAHVH